MLTSTTRAPTLDEVARADSALAEAGQPSSDCCAAGASLAVQYCGCNSTVMEILPSVAIQEAAFVGGALLRQASPRQTVAREDCALFPLQAWGYWGGSATST